MQYRNGKESLPESLDYLCVLTRHYPHLITEFPIHLLPTNDSLVFHFSDTGWKTWITDVRRQLSVKQSNSS